jgi:hypothetical protein
MEKRQRLRHSDFTCQPLSSFLLVFAMFSIFLLLLHVVAAAPETVILPSSVSQVLGISSTFAFNRLQDNSKIKDVLIDQKLSSVMHSIDTVFKNRLITFGELQKWRSTFGMSVREAFSDVMIKLKKMKNVKT